MKLPHRSPKLGVLLLLLAGLTALPPAAEAYSPQQHDVAYQRSIGAAFMQKIGMREDVLTLESGLQIQTILPGSGNRPRPNDSVVVNIKGYTVDGNKFCEGESMQFPLHQLVEGLRQGLLLMGEGGRSVIVFPCELGYGERGAEPDVPGGATLLFDVELLRVLSAAPHTK